MSALGFRPATKGSRKPDMPATSTLVSITARDLFFLAFRGNGDLRSALFLTIRSDRAQDFLFGNLADLFGRFAQRFQKFLLPSPAFPAARQVLVEISPAHSLLNLLTEGPKGHSQL